MSLKAAICQGCGGNLNVDEEKDYGFCPFCGLKYYTEKIINNTYITNDYSAATINVQAADIDNYIRLIREKIALKNYDEAEKLYNEAIVYDPDNEELLFTKIEFLFSKMQDEIFDMCEVRSESTQGVNSNPIKNYYEHFQSPDSVPIKKKYGRIKGINYKQIFSDYNDILSKITDPSILDKAFSLAIETLVNIYTPIEKLCTLFLMNKNIYGVTQEEREQYRRIMQANHIPIYGYLINLFTDNRISEAVIEKGLALIIAQYTDNPPSYKSKSTSALIAMAETTNKFFMFANCEKPKVFVKHKRGKVGEALYFGSYLLFLIKQNHPGYNSETLREFEKLSNEEEIGCYVATCVYGSYNCPEVWALRRYRDNYLKGVWYGRLFIKGYYAVSPLIVRFLGNAQWFKNLWKPFLDKRIAILTEKGYDKLSYKN